MTAVPYLVGRLVEELEGQNSSRTTEQQRNFEIGKRYAMSVFLIAKEINDEIASGRMNTDEADQAAQHVAQAARREWNRIRQERQP